MIVSIEAFNYKHFKEHNVIDFRVPKKMINIFNSYYKKSYCYENILLKNNKKLMLNKTIGLLGANASGKSTLLDIFNILYKLRDLYNEIFYNSLGTKKKALYNLQLYIYNEIFNKNEKSFIKIKYIFNNNLKTLKINKNFKNIGALKEFVSISKDFKKYTFNQNQKEYFNYLIERFNLSHNKIFAMKLERIFRAFFQGGLVLVDDEFNGLHEHILIEVLELFQDPALNKKNAQLIFITYHPIILNELKKHQVYIVEKDKHTKNSICYRLDSIKGLNKNDNLYSKYYIGKLGGVPEL
jgi:predicted ATPase